MGECSCDNYKYKKWQNYKSCIQGRREKYIDGIGY